MSLIGMSECCGDLEIREQCIDDLRHTFTTENDGNAVSMEKRRSMIGKRRSMIGKRRSMIGR
ncbi:unnamed protein product [Protopolystoma xenopodis]|uniref:Uncharacterized protein n=1 Tax=Protopolystoma xenopodis TaxID=117903 RepID=A0A448WZY9_9PLAT|nr:unnamed protein product [Protopolystoma xenopodis]